MNQLKSKCISYLGFKHKIRHLKLVHRALKIKDHLTDKPTVTDGNASCRNDNSWCHQPRQSRQNDDPLLYIEKRVCDNSNIFQA